MKKLIAIILLCLSQTLMAAPAKKITVILDWFVNPDHAPLIVAQQQGYFTKHGLNVTIVAPANPSDGPKLVAAGKADITISYLPALLQQVNQGLPLLRVGTLFPMDLNAIAVLKSGPIKSIKDLKGKTIGCAVSNVDQAMIGTMLKSAGLSLNDVTLVDVNYNLVQALLTHRVDAVTGVMRNFEPIEMELAGQPARLFYPQDYGVPDFDSEIWVINKNQAQQPWVQAFLTAIQEGTRYLQSHPETTWKNFATAYPELNSALNQRSWMQTYKLFTPNPSAFDKKKYQALAKFMQREKLITKIPTSYAVGSQV